MKRLTWFFAAALVASLAAPPAWAQSCDPNYTEYGSTPTMELPKAGCSGYSTRIENSLKATSDFIGQFANADGTLKDDVSASEWIQVAGTPTYISASSFSVPETAVFTMGRKVFANQGTQGTDVVGVVRSANTAGGTTTVVLGAIVLASDNLTTSTVTDPITSVAVSMVTPQSGPVAAVNASGYTGIFYNTGATADRGYTLPNVSGTVMVAGTASIADLAVSGNGSKIAKVNASGTAYELKAVPVFRAHKNGAQSINASTATKVQMDTETDDPNSNYNPSTYRFTPTVAGYYEITAAVNFINLAAGKTGYTYIYKNGALVTVGSGQSSGATSTFAPVHDLLYANGSTDYFELYCLHDDTAARSISGNNNYPWYAKLARPD